MKITYVQYPEIDKTRWDKCINSAVNGMVYAYSWFLDLTASRWDALILDDYTAVMPLPYVKRLGILALKQPANANQLGVFSTVQLNPQLIDDFLNAIPVKFKWVDVYLNIYNKLNDHKWINRLETTHQIDLILAYPVIHSRYSDATAHLLWQAQCNKIQILRQLNLKEFLLLIKETASEPISFEQLDVLRKIIPFCINNNLGETYAAYDENNMLNAAAFFVKTHQKTIMLIAAQSADGRDFGALAAILDKYISQNAEKNMTLDFASTAHSEDDLFYTGFGATAINYYHIKKNRIPVIGKIF